LNSLDEGSDPGRVRILPSPFEPKRTWTGGE
jgi:hypothetical protein